MKALLSIALLATTAVAQSSVADVNDPVSPGMLGDALLSLDEAIQVVNGTITLGQLSAGELAQISGGGVPTIIRIDAGVTPTITLQQTPSPLDGPAAGGDVAIRGTGGRPILDASGVALALRIRTNSVDVTDLAVQGGTDGFDCDASVNFQASRKAMFDGLEFSGLTGAGIRLSTAGSAMTMQVQISHSSFRSLTNAIEIDDRAASGSVRADVEYVEFDGVQRGADVFIDGNAMMTLCRMWRCEMRTSGQIVDVRRTPTSAKMGMVMIVSGDFTTTGDAVVAQNNSTVETAIHVHHSVIRPAAGKNSFVLGPSDSRVDWHASENIFYGDIDIADGRLNRRIWAWNNVFRDGVFSLANLGAPTSFRWNRFERCTIRALPANTAQMGHVSTEFESCTIDGQSAIGNVLLENCWLSATTTTGNVAQQSPAPSPWLAQTSASTATPSIGGAVDLTFDLPLGMIGVWELGLPDPRLVLTKEPWRDYALQSLRMLLPGIHAFHSTVRIPVPNDPNLVGLELYCTPYTAPFSGQTHVPPFNLPRGVYLTIR